MNKDIMWTPAQRLIAIHIIENETPQTAYNDGGMSFYNAFLCVFGKCLRKRLKELCLQYPLASIGGKEKQDNLNWELNPRSIHKWTPYSLRLAMGVLVQY